MITGRCLCGSVVWTSQNEPIAVGVCWCRACQKIGAGSGTVSAYFTIDGFSIKGETREYVSRADSGNSNHRQFCPTCGTPLFGTSPTRKHLIRVRVGTFDDPSRVRPAMTIWTKEAPDWAAIDPALPVYQGQPPPIG
jgi:hypothetical protein